MEDFDAFEAMAEFQAFQAEGGYADPALDEPDDYYFNPIESGYYDEESDW